MQVIHAELLDHGDASTLQLARQHGMGWISETEPATHCRRCLLSPEVMDWVVPHSIVLSSMAGQAGQPCGVLPRADDTARLVWSLVCLLSHDRERRYLCNPPCLGIV